MDQPERRQPFTVVVRRIAKRGREADFEEAMRAFIAESASMEGSREFHVIRPSDVASREYTVVHCFDDETARRAFTDSAMYAGWMKRLAELTDAEARIQEYGGLAGWFTLPGEERGGGPPPAWKMAIVTFLGVYPLTSVLPGWFMKALPGVHPLLVNVLTTGLIVGLLTWIVMPLLTRVFKRWLFERRRGAKEIG